MRLGLERIFLHDKRVIETFFRANPLLHVYSIGDLDDFFFKDTIWFGLRDKENIKEIALLFAGFELPTLVAITNGEKAFMEELLQSVSSLLPRRFYCHLSHELEDCLRDRFDIVSHGKHYKMGLIRFDKLDDFDMSGIINLKEADLDKIKELYRLSYPDNWFEPRMLETNMYYGIRRDERLVCIAGVHVYSSKYRVAALGNITTHPDYRGHGYARYVTAHLLKNLLMHTDYIGLNVHVSNKSAIDCYTKLGFEILSEFEEFMVEAK